LAFGVVGVLPIVPVLEIDPDGTLNWDLDGPLNQRPIDKLNPAKAPRREPLAPPFLLDQKPDPWTDSRKDGRVGSSQMPGLG